MQTYSLFLFISGKFWKFRLVHHYHFQLCSDHVYFCFCLLIFPHASPSETTVKMKPFLFIFRVKPGGPSCSEEDHFLPFSKCDVKYLQGATQKISFLGQHRVEMPEKRRAPSASAFLISIFLREYGESALFLLILLLPWGFVQSTHFFVHPSACFMNELQWTVFVSLLEEKNCPRILKSTLRPSPTVLSCNRVDVTLTSMYTKVLTEWDDTKRSTKCWQRNLSQNSPLPVLINFVWFTIQ